MSLESLATLRVRAVAPVPEARLAIRERWYRTWGGTSDGGVGFGRAELAFLSWLVRRRVLHSPVNGGSRWWAAMQEHYAWECELAGLQRRAAVEPRTPTGRAWFAYFDAPGPELWYRAHNTGIVCAYLRFAEIAAQEEPWERVLINQILYRVVFAHALVEGVLGELGEAIADPRFFSVALVTRLEALYPEHYPLTADEVDDVRHLGVGLDETLGRILDRTVILPRLPALYAWQAAVLGIPALTGLVDGAGRPIYGAPPSAEDPSV